MPKWTPEQCEVLYQCSQLGAKSCRDLIRKQCGANHTVEAVRKQANRLGLSVKKDPNPCPNCGSTEGIQASGFCRKCHYDFLIARQHRYRERLEAEVEAGKKAKREYDRVRQENARFAKENGLQSIRKWNKTQK